MTRGSDSYCAKRMGASLPYIAGVPCVFTDIAVVIPALNEFPLIKKTLLSLDEAASFYSESCRAKNQTPRAVTVIVTVNNKKTGSAEVKENNKTLFDFLQSKAPGLYQNMRIVALDCFSLGKEIGEKDGVGLARKIGLDYAYRCCISGVDGVSGGAPSVAGAALAQCTSTGSVHTAALITNSVGSVSGGALSVACAASTQCASMDSVHTAAPVTNSVDEVSGCAPSVADAALCTSMNSVHTAAPVTNSASFEVGAASTQCTSMNSVHTVALVTNSVAVVGAASTQCASMDSVHTAAPVTNSADGAPLECARKLLCFMDADTLVEKNYFSALDSVFDLHAPSTDSKAALFGVTQFHHQKTDDARCNGAIQNYERDLLLHSQKLKNAQSPWYPVPLGPTIVCTVKLYGLCGGMNRRVAGEDFYFLQTLLKTSPTFCSIPTTVHPSARISDRVVFGTGEAIQNALNGKPKEVYFPDTHYDALKRFLALTDAWCEKAVLAQNACTKDILRDANAITAVLGVFLVDEGFEKVWETLFFQNKKSACRLKRAFHCWFDALKTIRFFHALTKAQNREN